MADTIFVSGNYLIAENDLAHYAFPLSDTYYSYNKNNEEFIITGIKIKKTIVILKKDITKWENDYSIAYSESTFVALLRKNTGLKQ